ncbi:CopG family transcriptional regulator/antitoxin EndoAI [Orenia metallireducens]|jgi:CopG family transcriptional regulator/antitoxin EndoAI|uniref:CopG family transcriptional regulator / antitoxin EndoAI n=1 Tax=Orenia metallireducens TaxID=1413210 RepID=A0A285H795_9FIRM|nr:hypothetical protein [Orenia metallireducens]PRX21117.1 CopG family transcriptional regulator/antitoxin EndoAI [Orenia metallireducens]SNY31494.1 CopG family transcriptional regulator / antitoxin EndoAI [Orenia metallireducens]
MGQSQFLKRRVYSKVEDREKLKERLKRGYCQMAEINLKLAQEGLPADREAYQYF